jgi:hypothetical protein
LTQTTWLGGVMAPVGYDWLMSALNRIARAWSARILLRLSEGSFTHRLGASPRPSVSASPLAVGPLGDRDSWNTERLWTMRNLQWSMISSIANAQRPMRRRAH